MLVLSRKLGEVIVIDGGITITVVGLRGDKVRLGVEAPPTTAVHRFEVAQAIEEENRRAALPPPPRPLAGGQGTHPVRRDARRANGEDTR